MSRTTLILLNSECSAYKIMLHWNVSIPDANFSGHPAQFTKSAEKSHEGVVAYRPLWLNNDK